VILKVKRYLGNVNTGEPHHTVGKQTTASSTRSLRNIAGGTTPSLKPRTTIPMTTATGALAARFDDCPLGPSRRPSIFSKDRAPAAHCNSRTGTIDRRRLGWVSVATHRQLSLPGLVSYRP